MFQVASHRVGHCDCFFNWNVGHAHFSRGRDIAGRAALLRSGRFGRHWNRVRIFKAQSEPAKVLGAQSPVIQYQRLVDAGQPNLTGHPSAGAVVDLATQDVFVKSPGDKKEGESECRFSNFKRMSKSRIDQMMNCQFAISARTF